MQFYTVLYGNKWAGIILLKYNFQKKAMLITNTLFRAKSSKKSKNKGKYKAIKLQLTKKIKKIFFGK